MKLNWIKRAVSLLLSFAMVAGVLLTNTGFKAEASSETKKADAISVWNGSTASGYASGSGTQEDPYIIETADQLYRALTTIIDATNNVAGGKQTSQILKQSSTTEYVPVYTPYYYKVADGVEAFYLNDIRGSETLYGIKAFVAGSVKKEWKPGKSFVGNLDGNGVTIYGMYSSNGQGFVGKLDGSATIQNFNFNSCYSKGSGAVAIVTTQLGSYLNDSTIETIANVSVRNCYIETTKNATLNDSNQYSSGAAGIVSTGSTAEKLTIANALFDGYSCEVVQGSTSQIVAARGYVSALGGIISGGHSMNNITLSGCVSLGAPAVDEVYVAGKEVNYNRYDKNQGFQVYFYDSYTDYPTILCDAYPGKYDRLLEISRVPTSHEVFLTDMPKLNWQSNWELVNYDGRIIPMPKNNPDIDVTFASYAEEISTQNNSGGAYSVFGGAYFDGTYGMYHQLIGSGTKDDPYLISNAFQLARAIASGGVNTYSQLYYKLTCDIDASESAWITQDSIIKSTSTKYAYVPFNGVLDGDGYTVYNVYCGDDQSVGLIPVLASKGVVKNLHIRESGFVSGKDVAGAIAGSTQSGAVIEGCSAENCLVYGKESKSDIVGDDFATVRNSYFSFVDTAQNVYYKADGTLGDIDVSQNGEVWYLGGKTGSMPKLKNHAVTRNFADIDGDGIATEYSANDLVALRRRLLLESGYENVYGDINRDNKVNVSDLAVLSRIIVGSYNKLYDGFWNNAKLGQISIYYGENDNYDAARRLEIFLESQLPGVDIKKVVSADKTVSDEQSDKNAVYVHADDLTGKPKGSLEIIVGNIENYKTYSENLLDTNDYSITYDQENCVLWFNGGSFTGVEQAVVDFVKNSNEKTGEVYTTEKSTLSQEKWAKTVMVDTDYDGKADSEKVMYYAWGDEFDNENGQINVDTWNHARMRTETEVGKTGNYNNVETANEKELAKLYAVENGKLTITRGVKASNATSVTDELNYVRLYEQEGSTALDDVIDEEDVIANPGLIKTNHSFLWKQGYAEMYGALPSDGHTFASWWMLGHGSYNNWAMDEALYSKVYKRNDTGEYAYDGTSSWPISTDPRTYKYQVPTNYFEIDIWELMQNNGIAHSSIQSSKLTGFYDYRLYLNVHKFYSVGSRSNSTVNVIDWDNPGTPRAVMQKEWFGSKEYYFSTSAAYHDFTDGSTTRFTKNLFGRVTANYVESLQKQLTAPRRYGFYWSTNGVDKFNLTLYIYDANGDGVEDDNMILGTSDMSYNKDSGKNPQDYDCVNDAEVANQYMYFLFDNVLYSSNPKHSSATSDNAAMHTDMLTNNGTNANPDKIDLEIDYLRVYQYDGRRDIITRETENFNNGNHFGY